MKTKDSAFYITLSKEFLAKEGPAANKRAIKEFHGESEAEQKDTLYFESSDINMADEAEVQYDTDLDLLQITVNSDLGYFNWNIPLNLDIKIGIIENITKQFNKVKAMLESAK